MATFTRCVPVAALLAMASWAQHPLYRDPSVPLDKRVEDLLSRMTLDEKIAQLSSDAPAIERLGVPAYNWWNESLHGIARAGRATVFPQAIGLAATWDTGLMSRTATAISDEGRAKHHEFVRRGKRAIYQGLTFWTPNINLFRDPRWGRGMETYGEDPYLTARMAVAFIRAMQGDDPKYLKTVATAKHYAVHSGPETTRHSFDAAPSPRDLWASYLPHFEAAVKEGRAESVMCAYNSVNGLPACANPPLLQDILRRRWGFQGYVVSDCGAIEDIYKHHKRAGTPEQGVALAIKAGTDLNCGVEYAYAGAAVKAGLLSESDIDAALRRLLVARFRLGMFDPPEQVKWARIPYSVVDSSAHAQLALEAARKSIVLLKNDAGTLPLSKNLRTLAVIGANADDPEVMYGNYNGFPTAPVTPLEAIRRKLGQRTKVLYARGGELAPNLPLLDVIPSSALFTSNDASRKNGLIGAYYGSANFDGRRHRPRELTVPSSGQLTGDIPANPQPLFTRIDPQVDFEWWDTAPRAGMNDDDFGVRWTGYLVPPVSGRYQLGARALNAFELYIDGKLLVRDNSIHGRNYRYAAIDLEAGRAYAIRLDYHEYVNDASIRLVWSPPAKDWEQEAVETASKAEAVVAVLGLSPRLEGEEMRVPVEGFAGGDRVSIGLPRVQEQLLDKLVALGKPVVLVLMNGSALAINRARDRVPAIVEAWYPGQAGGTAIADVLFGDHNPAGRLPVTFYKSVDQLPPFDDYSMKGRTYRFFEGEPLFPFGFGLSYTTFAYRNLKVPKQVPLGEPVRISVDVENTGARAGEEVVQLYLTTPWPGAPLRSLEGFARVPLKPKERRTVEFTLTPQQLAEVTAEGVRKTGPGQFRISAGGGQPLTGATGVLTESFAVVAR